MARILEPKRYEIYEPGLYEAQCIEILETKSTRPNDRGEFKDQYKFKWALVGESGEPSDEAISGWVTQSIHAQANYPNWYRAHTGNAPTPPVDVDECLNKRVMLTIDVYTKEDGTEGNKVTNVGPVMKQRTAPRRAAPAPRPTDDGQLGRVQTETEVEAASDDEEAPPF